MGILDRLLGKRKEEKKDEEDFLRQLCRDDTKLFNVAAYSLNLEPPYPKRALKTSLRRRRKVSEIKSLEKITEPSVIVGSK